MADDVILLAKCSGGMGNLAVIFLLERLQLQEETCQLNSTNVM